MNARFAAPHGVHEKDTGADHMEAPGTSAGQPADLRA
jgi:hypothetical protein